MNRPASAAVWEQTVPHRKQGRVGAVIGSTLLAFSLGVAGVAVYYFHKKAEVAGGKLAGAQSDVTTARAALADLEKQLQETKQSLEVAAAAHDSEIERLKAERDTAAQKATEANALKAKLDSILKDGEGGVEVDKDRITLSLVEKVLFPSGEAYLTPAGEKVLAKVGAALKETRSQIWVQGHTDDIPIQTDDFESNWELSAARALTVVHYLQDEGKIEGQRLAAVAMSQYRPVSRKVKAKNRRIEIVLFPEQKLKVAKD